MLWLKLPEVSLCLLCAAGKPARLWWRYAIKAVQQQRAARKLSWNQAISVRSAAVL